MPRLTAVNWKILECIFELYGFKYERQKGDHRSYTKDGVLRPVVIPTYKAVQVDIILNNMRTARMAREEYFGLLEKCKSRG